MSGPPGGDDGACVGSPIAPPTVVARGLPSVVLKLQSSLKTDVRITPNKAASF